ncbi:phage tail tape measure protein [Serratia rubidaea]|uniref:Phage tail tape measure protein n=1 Tax=Serratia rubidaea TaxID=61652 RepID=A0A448S231_SERRU|nr:phage tail tape measure protein [Serratia rubidaea]MBH1930152.1 phage tail tape measure protein [Serratia rubidaea]MDC6120547.1 phage tail tape measure protein [Serratia rubidaea]MEB7588406.1 phage tail tape measure protein [Serratia rubidaea]VEI61706.1 Phage-related minor tail protein [Serratia rubidaea]
MSNQQAADDIILSGITLKAANRDVILSTKRVRYAQKQLAQLNKLAALKRQADEVQQQLNHNRAARASQPATISSMEDIKNGQQLIFDAVFQQARSKMLAFQQGRLSKKLGKKGVNTAQLDEATQQQSKRLNWEQMLLGANKSIQNDQRQRSRAQVFVNQDRRQGRIDALGKFTEPAAAVSNTLFSGGKQLFTPGVQFEQQLSALQAQLGLAQNDPHLQALQQQASQRQNGADTPADIQQAQAALANSGYDANAVLAAAPAALRLAKASGSSIDEAVKALTGVQQAFKLPVDQANNIADVMAKASNSYALPLTDLNKQLVSAAPDALSRGTGLEQTAAQLAPAGKQLGNVAGAAQAIVTVRGDNLDGDIQKLFASWDRIRIDLFGGQNSALRELTQTATKWLDTLQQWVTNNPELTATLITVAGAIAVLLGGLAGIGTFIVPALSAINMLMSGAALLGGIFSGVGSAIAAAFAALGLPIFAVIAAVIAGAAVIYKYWEPISAFIGGIIDGVLEALAPFKSLFEPIGEVFSFIIEKIKEFLTPVKMTQEGLNKISDVGRFMGKALAEALTDPLSLVKSVSGYVVGLLEKVGLLKKEAKQENSLPPPAAPVLEHDTPINAVRSPLTTYQPAITPGVAAMAGNRTVTNNVTIHTTPGMDREEIHNIYYKLNQEQQWESDRLSQSQFAHI